MTLPIDRIVEFQGTLKKLSKKNLEKLKKRILEDGFNVPFFVWDNAGEYQCLDGHQRLKALLSLREEGYDMPLLPVAIIEASDIADARKKLLAISSQYGEFDAAELDDWLSDMDASVAETLRLVDTEMALDMGEDENYGEDFSLPDGEKEPFQQITFTLADAQAEYIKGKLIEAKIGNEFNCDDCFGNENSNGNALYFLIKGLDNEQG
jgi:hypothetical protein